MSYTARSGDPTWVDLYTADPDRAIAFYGDLFGWTAERGGPEYGGYITFRKDGRAVAGAMGRVGEPDPLPDRWTVYLAAPDADAVTAAAKVCGGEVIVPPMPVADLGVMGVLADPGGAGVGLWQKGTFGGFETIGQATGGVWSEHDGIPTWFELMTRDYDAALGFYRQVFDWDDTFVVADTPEFRYTTLHATSPMLGGVMDGTGHLPDGVPGAWTVYFGAEDVDKAVARAVELGGGVSFEPMDTPYGRLAGLTDPTGAHFSVGGTAR
ncbi:VOC family protein [Nocardia thailandica]|uniref:VOC family protein n=1 Tax=Nocardia thailandica TaxID=257275 RepID=A0ABW6PUV4_9NOCA|nr:VOC family protein [Nocardia thailandica]